MQDISAYEAWDFHFKSVFLFNTEAVPENPRPSEQEIQDAKLQYYYPEDTNKDEQRNQVGLAEGFFMFCDTFIQQEEKIKYPRYQSIHLSEQTYITVQHAPTISLFFAVQHPPFASVQNSPEYYQPSCHQVVYCSPQQMYANLCDNFIQHLLLWYGEITPNTLSQFIPRWIKCQVRDKQMNFLTFQHKQLKYAPIDAQLFLTLQYLISMLHQLDLDLLDITIFYQGYFIYSTLNHRIAVLFKEHYFGAGIPWAIDDSKINTKFEHSESNNAFMSFHNFKNSTEKFVSQDIFINGEKQNYYTFLEKGLLICMGFKPTHQVNKLKDIQSCMMRNSLKISVKLDSQIEQTRPDAMKERFLYYNGMNFAFKVSNSLQLSKIAPENLCMLEYLCSTLEESTQKSSIIRMQIDLLKRSGQNWFCGVRTLSRTVIVVLPTSIPLAKVDEELGKAIESTFSSLFL